MTIDRSKLRTIQRFLLNVRQLDQDMSVQRLNVLLDIAINGETDQGSVVRRCGLSRSGGSKNVAAWSALTSTKRKGPGLVSSTADPMNLKTRILRLTPRGEAALEKVLEDL